MLDLNQRPPACEAGALPTELIVRAAKSTGLWDARQPRAAPHRAGNKSWPRRYARRSTRPKEAATARRSVSTAKGFFTNGQPVSLMPDTS